MYHFEIAAGFIRLHIRDQTVWSVPDIRIRERRPQEAILDLISAFIVSTLGAQRTPSYLCEYLVTHNNGAGRDGIL